MHLARPNRQRRVDLRRREFCKEMLAPFSQRKGHLSPKCIIASQPRDLVLLQESEAEPLPSFGRHLLLVLNELHQVHLLRGLEPSHVELPDPRSRHAEDLAEDPIADE